VKLISNCPKRIIEETLLVVPKQMNDTVNYKWKGKDYCQRQDVGQSMEGTMDGEWKWNPCS
jgi:hypothetical protein